MLGQISFGFKYLMQLYFVIVKGLLLFYVNTYMVSFLNSSFPGMVTPEQQNVTFLMQEAAMMVRLMTSKSPG
jgi:hypothetical protein